MLIQNDVKWKKWAVSALLCIVVMLTQQVVSSAQTDFDCTAITDGLPQSECEALVALYNGTDGANWVYANGASSGQPWLTTNRPCDWYGVSCTTTPEQVFSLELRGRQCCSEENRFGLQGDLPPEIGDFPKLGSLWLSNNQLTSIPPEIGNLTNLYTFSASGNPITSLPDSFWTLTNLQSLTLMSNQLTSIPPEIGNLTQLNGLIISNNQITSIPPEIGNLTEMQSLVFSYNPITSLPSEIDNLTKMHSLHVNNTQLEALPDSLWTLTDLTRLFASDNPNLVGELPMSLTDFSEMFALEYENTQLCEPADPAFHTWLSSLQFSERTWTLCTPLSRASFDCANVVDGMPQAECEGLEAMYDVLDGENWTYDRSGSTTGLDWMTNNAPCSWYGITCYDNHSVQYIGLDSVGLTGDLPEEIGRFTQLETLALGSNQITSIPPNITGLISMTSLTLNNNALQTIPAEIGQLPNLEWLVLVENQLTAIPDEIGDLPKLNYLYLNSNPDLQGELPRTFLGDNIDSILYYDTQLCEPADEEYQTWLITVSNGGGIGTCGDPSNIVSPTPPTDTPPTATSSTATPPPTPTPSPAKTDLLGVYLLSMDNAAENSNNLTPRYGETIQSLTTATEGSPDKTAVVLADLERDGDTHILIMNNGVITSIVGLPDGNGILDIDLTEYDMTDGTQLGGFLKWALANYGGEQVSTVVSFVGHGSFLVPDVSLEDIGEQNGLSSLTRSRSMDPGVPLPFRVDISADYTDVHPHKRLITPYALKQMLEIGTADTGQPINVLDLSHCFAASVEQFYEVAGETPLAESIIGSPNYAYFAPDMLGQALSTVSAADDSETMSSRIVETYDTLLTTYDGADGDTETTEHPRSLVAVSSAGLSAVKTTMDGLSDALLQAFDANGGETQQLLAAAHRNTTQFYDTTYCVSDWELTHEDALVDIGAFMAQIEGTFDGDVASRAADVSAAVNSAIIASTVANGTPWFSNGEQQWVMDGANAVGLSLYADLYGLATADVPNERTLSWHAAYYDKVVTAENPNPFAFISGGTTWSDVFTRYWQETASDIALQNSVVCFPMFAPVQDVIALDTRGGIKDIALDWQVEHPLGGILAQYNVYKYEVGSSPILLTSQAGARYVDENTFTDGRDYCYYVEAVDGSGTVIGTSNTDCERYGELQLVVPHQVVPPDEESVSMPISIINGNGLCPTGIDILLEYDPEILAVTGVSNTMYAENYNFESNLLQPGQVNIASVSGICEPLAGRGSLFDMQFDVIGIQGDISPINFVHGITATAIFDEGNVSTPVDVRLVDGSASVSADFIRGDVNGDEAISAIDAYLSLQIASGEWVPTLIQDAACDVNGDGVCNSADSSLILCYAANEKWSSCGLSSTRRSAQQKTVEQVTQVEIVERNGDGYLPVNLNSPQGIAGGALTFTYEPAHITLNGVHLDNTLLTDVTITADEVTGLLRVAFADDATIGADGTLIYLDVTPRLAGATVQLAGAQFNDAAGLDWETNLGNDITLLTQTYNIPLAVEWQQQTASIASTFILLLTIILLTGVTVGSIGQRGGRRL